jgi:hypothetical protein
MKGQKSVLITERGEIFTQFETVQEREYFGDLIVDGQTILKYSLNKYSVKNHTVLL